MKKTIILNVSILFYALITISCGNSTAENNTSKENNTKSEYVVNADSVNLWLSDGEHIADIMDVYDERLNFLSTKLAGAISNNQEWYFEYAKTIPDGETMPYHPNLGLTKEEYEEMLLGLENVQVFSSGQEKIKIIKDDNIISFKAFGEKTQGFNYISFNTYSNTAHLDLGNNYNFTLKLTDTITNNDTLNQLRSPWHGYVYKYSDLPPEKEIENIRNISEIEYYSKQTKIIEKLKKDGRIFLSSQLKGKENGEAYDVKMQLLIK